jgi:hypothetical protein
MLLGVISFFFLWEKMIIPAACCMALLVFLIERFLRTTYTITTDGRLIISPGRFFGSRTIRLDDITFVEKRKSVSILGFSLLHYVMIGYGAGRYMSLVPQKEMEFMTALKEL